MEKMEITQSKASARQEEDEAKLQELVESLPKERNWYGSFLYFYQGFWCPSPVLKSLISFQNHFQANDNDIIIVSAPKCGTTWMKSLIFTIVNRHHFEFKDHPLLNLSPHDVVPNFEYEIYFEKNPSKYLENNISNPRIFSTHTPYASLPTSIKNSNCKIVYLCRNPMDMFISYLHFTDVLRPKNINPPSLNEAFDMFCQGIHSFGPFFDHVLGFWDVANEVPNKVLFLKYEDLQEDIFSHTRKLAEFLGFPFSKEEEEEKGVIEEVAKLCSFEKLKNLEVNKTGKRPLGWLPHTAYFRKGMVGDWKNYLTPSMIECLEKLCREKLDNSGLTFKNQLSCTKQ